ncbi:uncharacterized protein LOC124722903 [Schistocerca piceifrons]|uniref:uncharacterized protein LOC124722903 n=1 Tax=Schistocerca piceifrons TaxID=274613 RepID=UPI001F5EF606|nr:uncharacterized protein LOC124722903 [Schistocerca piceifrons]
MGITCLFVVSSRSTAAIMDRCHGHGLSEAETVEAHQIPATQFKVKEFESTTVKNIRVRANIGQEECGADGMAWTPFSFRNSAGRKIHLSDFRETAGPTGYMQCILLGRNPQPVHFVCSLVKMCCAQ